MFTSSAKIDWKAFEYIHSANPREAFQMLTEQLFCYEFKQPYGIYRFFNQPYIETMPIHFGDDYIGFQSKYYDAATSLSDKKSELIAAIDGAYSKYPGINKIVFYTNKEAGMSTASGETVPAYIERIEKHGAAKGISVEWRGLNELATILLRDENASLRDYFFAADGGVRKEFAQIKSHTNSILKSISSEIRYHGQSIKLPNSVLTLDSIWDSDKNITIIHGEGGCGKSGVVKDILEPENAYPIMMFKATDFDWVSISDFSRQFGDCTWEDFLFAFDDAPHKLCVVDSAEKAFLIKYQETFSGIIRALLSHGWKILFTIRTTYLADFMNLILRTSDVDRIRVSRLSLKDLSDLEQKYAFSTPQNEKLKDLLCNLFYLNMYLSQGSLTESQNEVEFFECIWKQVICKDAIRAKAINIRRSAMICKIVRNIASSGLFYYVVDETTDQDALDSLCESEILQYDDTIGGYFITHDVYEELVLKKIISQEFARKTCAAEFFAEIGDWLLIRKAFRTWLHDRFDAPTEDIERFLSNTLRSCDIAPIWKDDILIALFSENHKVFSAYLDSILTERQYGLWARGMHLLNTACRVIDDGFCRQIFTEDELSQNTFYRFTKPAGMGWDYLISFSYAHRESISWSSAVISLTVEVLDAWSRYNPIGETTRYAGLLALFLYPKVVGYPREYHLDEKYISKICDTILSCSNEIDSEISAIVNEIIGEIKIGSRNLYNKLCRHLLKDALSTGSLCRSNPDLVVRLAKHFWIENNSQADRWNHGIDIGVHFGLREYSVHTYYPSSAFQTPLLPLLQAAPRKAIDFIVELFDAISSAYKNSDLNTNDSECTEIEIHLPDGHTVMQVASNRLWEMHRGTSVAPHLLVSILMALERWLYYAIPDVSNEIANGICLRLLSQSHSAAITAVVTSMVLAYPQKLFDTACILIQTKEILQFDIARFVHEQSANFLLGLSPANRIYDDERIQSNNLSFRKKRLEEIILSYQFASSTQSDEVHTAQKAKLYAAIDSAFSSEEALPEYARFALYRMDLRKMKLERGKDELGQDIVALISDLPDSMLQAQQKIQEPQQYDEKYINLQLWSTARFKHNADQYKKYHQYESDPQTALIDGFGFLEKPCSLQVDNRFIIYVAAVLLLDFQEQLDTETFNTCSEIILTHAQNVIEEQTIRSIGDGTDAAIAALPALIGKTADDSAINDPIMLLFLLLCDWGFQRDHAIKSFREHIWDHPDLAHKLVALFVQLKPHYDNDVSKYRGISPFEFLENELSIIQNTLQQPPQPLPSCTDLSCSAQITLNLLMPKAMNPEAYGILVSTGEKLWPQLFTDNHYSRDDDWPGKYEQKYAYIKWFAEKLLRVDANIRTQILTKLSPHLSASDGFNDLLSCIISAQDRIRDPAAFWDVWLQFLSLIEALCAEKKDSLIQMHDEYYRGDLDKIVETYLFAFPLWKENAHEWHTLRLEDSIFFTKAVEKIGYYPVVLDSIARVLNSVGYIYCDYGIVWLSTLMKDNPHLSHCNLNVNTQYYIEEYVQRFCNNSPGRLKKNAEIRHALITVLNFLVDLGSTTGYMLREKYC